MFVWVSMISCEDHIFVVPFSCLGRDCSCLTDIFSPFTHYLSPFIHRLHAEAFPRYASVTGKPLNTSLPSAENAECQIRALFVHPPLASCQCRCRASFLRKLKLSHDTAYTHMSNEDGGIVARSTKRNSEGFRGEISRTSNKLFHRICLWEHLTGR